MLSGTHSIRSIFSCGTTDRIPTAIRNVSKTMHSVRRRVKAAAVSGRWSEALAADCEWVYKEKRGHSGGLLDQSLGEMSLQKEREKPATIRDVARVSGVSVGTVSRSLTAPDSVRPATLGKVRPAIQTLAFAH